MCVPSLLVLNQVVPAMCELKFTVRLNCSWYSKRDVKYTITPFLMALGGKLA